MSQAPAPITPAHNIANFAVELVVALGSDTVFSLTGGMALHLNRAVAAHPTAAGRLLPARAGRRRRG